MSTTAVIPIKQLENAKQRLSGLLSLTERKMLFTAMVEDVLTAIEACVLIDKIVVVTDDEAVADLGLSFGATIQPEPSPPGLIQAVTAAGQRLAAMGVSTMLFLPGDVPLVTPLELEVVLEGFGLSNHPEFIIVPASDLGGSNCLACSPPDCMQFRFGEDSFRKHLIVARELGIEPSVAKLPGIGLDIDTPDDLRALVVSVETGTREIADCSTLRFLVGSGIIERLLGMSAS